MTEERKYQDREISKILDLAIRGDEVGARPLPAHDGLTLSELQDVGRDVGLDPESVARAALAFEAHQETLPRGTTLGMPTSVGRIVELPRAVTDHEWDLLVSELRMTFGAKGDATSHGGLREWSNGNLHTFVEPTETGHQLRMTTVVKGDAMVLNLMGGIGLLFALMLLIVLLGKDDPGARFVVPLFFAIMSGGAWAANVIRLPRWANEREQQMEYIANRAKALIGAATHDDD